MWLYSLLACALLTPNLGNRILWSDPRMPFPWIASVCYFPLILNSSLFDFCCHHFSHLATLSPCHPFFLPLVETQSWKSPTIWSLGSQLGSWALWDEITQLFSSSAFSAEAFHSGRKLLKPLTSLVPPHSHLLFSSTLGSQRKSTGVFLASCHQIYNLALIYTHHFSPFHLQQRKQSPFNILSPPSLDSVPFLSLEISCLFIISPIPSVSPCPLKSLSYQNFKSPPFSKN